MPLPLQAKLLRFLEERTIERVGGRVEIAVNAHIVSATNQDLVSAHRAGNFREDLFCQLAESVFEVPPLRARDDDCLAIARHLLREQAAEQGRNLQGFTNEALGAILAYRWPGNVRELQNKVRQAVVSTEGRFITADDLSLDAGERSVRRLLTLKETREIAERNAVDSAMK